MWHLENPILKTHVCGNSWLFEVGCGFKLWLLSSMSSGKTFAPQSFYLYNWYNSTPFVGLQVGFEIINIEHLECFPLIAAFVITSRTQIISAKSLWWILHHFLKWQVCFHSLWSLLARQAAEETGLWPPASLLKHFFSSLTQRAACARGGQNHHLPHLSSDLMDSIPKLMP